MKNKLNKIVNLLFKQKKEITPAQIANKLKIHPKTALSHCLYGEELHIFEIEKKTMGKNTIHFVKITKAYKELNSMFR